MQSSVNACVETCRKTNTGIVLNINSVPYLAHHGFLDMLVVPGAFFIDVAISLDKELYDRVPRIIRNVLFEHPVILSARDTTITVEVNAYNDRTEYRFYEAEHRYSARMEIERESPQESAKDEQAFVIPTFQSQCDTLIDQESFYRVLS